MAKFDSSKAIAHLSAKWAGRLCPMCGVGNWNVALLKCETGAGLGSRIVVREWPTWQHPGDMSLWEPRRRPSGASATRPQVRPS